MPRSINRLSARFVETAAPGKHRDGGNLLLVVAPNGSRRWAFVYQRSGKETEMGLGSAGRGAVTLAEARERAMEARRLLLAGVDPLQAKRKAEAPAPPAGPTFGEFADRYVREVKAPSLRNAKALAQWEMTLTTYCDAIRDKPIADIGVEDVLTVLRPLWSRVPETASRLRARIENILDAARVAGLRTGENPARWKGQLQLSLPKRKVLTRGHHAALPFEKIPAFIAALRQRPAIAALALEFLILTAARSGEVTGATFNELDVGKAIWIIPASRMKAHREHRVPLSARACEIVKRMAAVRQSEFVFPGARQQNLSGMAFAMLLRRMRISDVTTHGFRSSFRDWCSETTAYPSEVAEMALAHVVPNATEAAYRRGDLFEKRRGLMEAWGQYCLSLVEPNTEQTE
jgi:integrase